MTVFMKIEVVLDNLPSSSVPRLAVFFLVFPDVLRDPLYVGLKPCFNLWGEDPAAP